MNICVYGASSTTIDQSFIIDGELLGEEMAKEISVWYSAAVITALWVPLQEANTDIPEK